MSCSRHQLCAYDGTEADRCPLCHNTWTAIGAPFSARYPLQGGGTRAHHATWHAERDARAAKAAARKLAKAALGAAWPQDRR